MSPAPRLHPGAPPLDLPPATGRRLVVGALLAAAAGAVLWGGGFLLDSARAWLAYLGAFVTAVTVALGALGLVMIAHASGARWFVVVRRLAESLVAALPAFLLLFVPLAFGLAAIYPWVPPLDGLEEPLVKEIRAKDAWLNVPFFLIRSFVYLAAWAALGELLRRWSLRQDEVDDTKEGGPRRSGGHDGPTVSPRGGVRISAAGLPVYGLTVTFAAFDWVMSLAPGWRSSIFGVYLFAGAMVAGLGALAVLLHALRRRGLLAEAVGASHVHALGRLLLTFTAFWAYAAYSQGFLIWIADLPHEAEWYLARWEGGWSWILGTLVVGHFAVPFFLLLSRRLKRSGRALAAVGAWLLLMHAVDVFWLVLPALHHPDAPAHRLLELGVSRAWLDLGALLLVGGLAVAFAAWRQSGHALVPRRDPALAISLDYESP